MFKRILVPLDGSQLAEQALAPAGRLARAWEAELLLLRGVPVAQPILVASPMLGGYESVETRQTGEVWRRDALDYLNTVQRRHECAGCAVRPVVEWGDAASAVVDTARERAVDLIVMSAHGNSGARRAMFGSVTERVLHSVNCPVLAVRSADPIHCVLITLDGSPLSERALPPALAVAQAFAAQVALLRVIDPPPFNPLEVGLEWDWAPEPSDEAMMAETRQAAAEQLRRLAIDHGLNLDTTPLIVLEGAPADRIQEFARLSDVDLVAMSTHGRTGLRRWLFGSITGKVMRGCERSMLIVRPPAEELL